MSEVAYSPGQWVALAGEGTWLLVEADPDARVVERCWRLVRSGSPLDPVVEVLLRHARGGACAVRYRPDERRVVLTGDARFAGVRAGTGWLDEPLDPDLDELFLDSGWDPPGPVLPLLGGVVGASALHVRTGVAPRPRSGDEHRATVPKHVEEHRPREDEQVVSAIQSLGGDPMAGIGTWTATRAPL
ncbi:hypothetical protein KCV87_11730 [Actinosynnema pretiosum subsp. pretiosum]|uniref:Uncharacterized protein n=2 Tax=Actinosynnema TaxID=40566 RepID=C6WCL8_ACTMD|nr:hypothetical protein [Actinosynnema mirum]ACU35635.1 hypothetical protein Amir_1686 [Actinosynnema mirum DSM 43827]AXX29065.1 hypothetical protein APASM_1700 [Actinosynnema pretiosum subsp. pretiosum]QUF06657.1 hypothetical protein KCV87_11730 [Actinosynnema pretiosum subsp. pretiosum]